MSQPVRPKPARAWTRKDLHNLLQPGLRVTQSRPAIAALLRALHVSAVASEGAVAQLSQTAQTLLQDLLLPDRPLRVSEVVVSSDQTRRILFTTADGETIESVIIPAAGGDRVTLCVSCQVGCGRRCSFCETGRLGLLRNLGADEIVEQFRQAQLLWQPVRGDLPPITNVVFMGMGEPLDNLQNVTDAIDLLCDPHAYALGWQHITVSTVGVAKHLQAFFSNTRAHLALSLHAPDDKRRSQVMPINQRIGLQDLKTALQNALPPKRVVLVEYILFDGFNDSAQDAVMLQDWLKDLPVRLNLIPANPGPDPSLRQPDLAVVRRFQKQMQDMGVRTLVRYPHGRDVGGACGQLAGTKRLALQGSRIDV